MVAVVATTQGRTAARRTEAPADPEFPQLAAGDPVIGPSKPRLLGVLGPGLITGASDDDPSGIATYSQAGAQIGFGVLWLMPFTYPLMAVTQEISARMAVPPAMASPATSVGSSHLGSG